LSSAIAQRDDARRDLYDAEARTNALEAEQSQLPVTLNQLESDLSSRRAERTRIMAEADQERSRQNSPDHPAVTTAKELVLNTTAQLDEAKQTFAEKTAEVRDALAAATKTYNEGLAPYLAKVSDAERLVAEAQKNLTEAQAEIPKLKADVGGFKRFWWKLIFHFDVDKFWKEQDAAVKLAAAPVPNRPAAA
jgi:hypothetical protein